jgi:glycosyltransferase involved in cell wall biosynthesis/tetratricopeptide (TPR) repeat protein
MTDAELLYQPHHRDRPMPLLRVEDVRRALRCAFELPEAQRQEMGRRASLVMECAYGHAVVVPALLKAIQAGLEEKFSRKPATAQTQRDDSPPAPASAAALAVSWEGTFLDFGSLSHVNREITRQLECDGRLQLARVNLAPPLRPETIPAPFQETARRLASRPPADARVTVRHAWPPNWTPPARGAWVLVQPWEFGAVPAEWVRNSGRVDEIWVPSRCARQMYVDSGVAPEKVHVVPNGIDPAVFRPDAPPLALPTEKSFKFLFVGGTIRRKGPDALLRAYGEHFTAADDVCLVIKDFGGKDVYAGQTFAAEIQAAQARPGAPEILYLTDDLPDIAGLYTACDCLVHPYRGEGFGLPVLEAMACGLPVVVTAGGATDDFATDDFAYRIASRRVSLGREVGGMPLAAEGWWLEPSLAELGSAMQQVWQQREEARAKGRAASEHARREWTWERAARVAADRLQGLAAKTTARPARKAAPIELPPVAKLGHLGPAHELFRQKKWIEAWNAVLAALQVRPFHPEACLLLAEIAQAAGDFTRARQLAQYAQKMAPKWKPIRQFLKALPPRSAGTRFALPAQPDRSRSTPLGGRLTVCLITKNEEQFLGQCLASVRDLADQIVVMDTGSTDWTMDIARRYGAEVHQCEWTDDFSAARNAALEHATGDWVLVLDADEELRAGDQAALRKMLQDEGAIGWRLPIVDVGREEEGHSYVPRLFRNAPGLFFVGRVHEQIFSSVEVRRQEWGLENRLGQATLLHHGYTKELTLQRNKVERNLRLLERAVAELPGEPNLLMNYGLELARAGRRDEGIRRYWEAFDEISALPPAQVAPELRETLLTQLCSHLLGVKDWPGVVRALTGPLAKRGGLTASLHFALGLAWMEQRRWSDAAEQFRLCLSKRHQPALSPINKEVLRAGPHHCLALCLKALRRPDDAARAFAAALKDDPRSRPARCDYALFLSEQGQPVEALKLLHQLIGEQADDPAAWLLGGQIALSQPEFLEFARDWTGEAVKHLPAHPRLIAQRAEALLLSQQPAEALACWRLLPPDAGTRALAGRLICELLGDAEGAVPPAAEPAVSQEFLQWYRALVRFGARDTIDRLNHQLDRLRDLLPTAVGVLERALAEAAQPAAA